jgi:hypothetical protein
MTPTVARPTVFLSSAAADADFAREVAEELTRAGAEIWEIGDVAASGKYTHEVRRALDRSGAVVVALARSADRREIPASVLFEIGAASGAQKPVFVVVDSPISRLPFSVPGMQVIPFNRVGEVPQLIRAAEQGNSGRKTG